MIIIVCFCPQALGFHRQFEGNHEKRRKRSSINAYMGCRAILKYTEKDERVLSNFLGRGKFMVFILGERILTG